MKRIVLAAVAISMLAVPMAQAQQYHRPPQGMQQQNGPSHFNTKHEARKPFAKKQRWSKGSRMSDWKRKQHVRDYHRYGLQRPGRGQQWVKVDNDYLLISMATGIIAGIAAGR